MDYTDFYRKWADHWRQVYQDAKAANDESAANHAKRECRNYATQLPESERENYECE